MEHSSQFMTLLKGFRLHTSPAQVDTSIYTKIADSIAPRRFTIYKYFANLVLLTHPRAGTSRLLIKPTLLA